MLLRVLLQWFRFEFSLISWFIGLGEFCFDLLLLKTFFGYILKPEGKHELEIDQ